MSDLTLFYANGACSLAPHIALEETGVPYTPHRVDTAAGEQNQPAFLAINPKARVPALRIDDWVLTENTAILPWIGQMPEAHLWPAAPAHQARALEWIGWIASTVHIAYAHIRRAERYATGDDALANVQAQGRVITRAAWEAVEARLGARRGPGAWAVGDAYSVVDPYLLVFWMWGRGAVLGYDMARDFPAWTDHARRMGARPAVQRVLAREGATAP